MVKTQRLLTTLTPLNTSSPLNTLTPLSTLTPLTTLTLLTTLNPLNLSIGAIRHIGRACSKRYTLGGRTFGSVILVGLQNKVAKKFAKFWHLSWNLSQGSLEVSTKGRTLGSRTSRSV